jgi:hypothetical protein
MELAGAVVPQGQQARPAGGKVDIAATSCAGKVFPDVDVAQVRPDRAGLPVICDRVLRVHV